MSVPFTLRPLLGPEAVFVFVVELVVKVVVVVEVFHFLVVQLVLVQLVVEVLFELLVLLEVLELLVDVVAATLERPPHRRCHGQHRPPRRRLRLAYSSIARNERASLRRAVAWSSRLRSRTDDGVTSISSSSSMYSSANSSVIWRGGSRITISSDAVVRMFVSFFSFVAFPSRSATITPRLRPDSGPAHGPYSRNR